MSRPKKQMSHDEVRQIVKGQFGGDAKKFANTIRWNAAVSLSDTLRHTIEGRDTLRHQQRLGREFIEQKQNKREELQAQIDEINRQIGLAEDALDHIASAEHKLNNALEECRLNVEAGKDVKVEDVAVSNKNTVFFEKPGRWIIINPDFLGESQ